MGQLMLPYDKNVRAYVSILVTHEVENSCAFVDDNVGQLPAFPGASITAPAPCNAIYLELARRIIILNSVSSPALTVPTNLQLICAAANLQNRQLATAASESD